MFRIAVCDRNQDVVKELFSWIQIDGKKQACNIETTCYSSAEELLWDMEERCRYDVVFLEFEMNDCKGLEYAKTIAKTDELCEIIFIAESVEYAYEAYCVHPFYFLKKPIDRVHFQKIFAETCTYLMRHKDRFSFCSNRRHYQVLLRNISHFQSDRNRIIVSCLDGEQYFFYDTMKHVEQCIEMLAIRFIRTHQSFLVNFMHIKVCECDHIEMKNGEFIPISEDRRRSVRREFYLGR